MHKIPNDALEQFEVVLMKKLSPVSRHADYRKWLRYYLDFSAEKELEAGLFLRWSAGC